MIPKEWLVSRYWLASPETPVEHLVAAFEELPEEVRMSWYAVAEPEPGQWAVFTALELFRVLEKEGASLLEQPLGSVAQLTAVNAAVDRAAMGIGQARRIMHRQPDRRLVVLEDGKPVGLLCDVFHAGVLGGLMLELYGRKLTGASRGEIWYTCPQCGRESDFVELIDLETNLLTCPDCHCHIAESIH